MATLIASKQISGVVTASVINGEFLVSGSSILTGSMFVTGAISASEVSASSFLGSGTNLTFGGTGIISGSSQLTTEFDSRYINTNADGVISGSSQLTSSFDSRYINTNTDNVVSGSSQISLSGVQGDTDDVSEGSSNLYYTDARVKTKLTAEGVISGSSQVTISQTSGYTAFSSSIAASVSSSTLPEGVISGSSQVDYDDITDKPAFIGGTNVTVTSGSGGITINSTGGGGGGGGATDISYLNQYTSSTDTRLGIIESTTSSLDQRLDQIESNTGSYGSGGDISSLNTFTSSIQTEVDGLSSATSSYLTSSGSVSYDDITSKPSGLLSGSEQITALGFVSESGDTIPAGTISGSEQITSLGFISSSHTDITSLNSYTSSTDTRLSGIDSFTSSIQTEVDGISAATSSYLTQLPSGVVSGSVLRTLDGTDVISGSAQITALGFVSSSGDSTPAGTISGSQQITDLGFISSSDSTTSLNSYTSSTDTRLTNIESTTSSLDQRLDQIESNTGSYSSTTDITHLNSFTSSIDTTIKTKINVDGVVSGSLSSSIAFDGNRTVSNTDLPSGVYNNNFGTSGSIQDFISSVFFPNTAPTINSTQFTIAEFLTSGSTVGTLSATDAEGQSITFSTQSAYSDDKVKVSTAGVITLTETATSESFNTTISGSIHAHEVEVTATDTFNSSTDKTIHIIVTPNEAPKFREGSTGGNVITNVTSSLNENSSNGTLVKRVFFTDAESDTITIDSSSISPADHFSITKYSTYVDITQNTGSLDYETYPTYTFSISASDEHYQAGQDNDAIVTLPISVSVSDNAHPTINNQTLSSISENSSNGATVGSISATDVDSDTITFSNFELHKLELDNSNVSSGSYGGTSQATDPHENPFQMTSAGLVTRKTGVLINSDLINEYQYRVIVKDNFNTASNEAIVTIPISDDTPASISTNGTFRIVESAVSGALIRTNANGFSGTQADLSSNQSGTFTNSSNPAIAVNSSNGNLSLAVDLSGSVTQSGDTIVSNITFTNTFGTTTVQSVTANVVTNSSPTISFTNQTANFETDLALNGVTMVSMSVSDTEGDTPYSASLSGTGASSLNLVYSNSDSSSIGIHANGNLSAGTYTYNVKVTDSYGESTTYSDRTITVATSADYGRVFVYDVGFNNATYNTAVGIDSEDSSTPPVATPYSNIGFLDAIINDDRIGDSSFTYSYGGTQTATKLGEASGSNLHDVLRTMGSSGVMSRNSAKHFVILFPSGSDMGGIPTTTTDSYGGSTAGEYVLEVGTDGTTIDGSNTLEASEINQMTLGTSHVGFTKWFMVGAANQIASSTNFNLGLNPSSGSGGA